MLRTNIALTTGACLYMAAIHPPISHSCECALIVTKFCGIPIVSLHLNYTVKVVNMARVGHIPVGDLYPITCDKIAKFSCH